MQARVRLAGCARNPLRRSCVSSARNAGKSAICRLRAQPSAEIVRVECAKCRRERDSPAARATLCGDRACRVREMQARVRFAGCARNPLRRSCVSSARHAGESAICRLRAQPSAEIARVECAKCRRECDLPAARATLCGDRARRVREIRRERDSPAARATLCGDRACRVREMQARVRFAGCARNPLRRSFAGCARTICGDHACRVREMQARARFAGCARNPLRRSCVSSARNAGESASCRLCAQPSAEIGRVECAKRRRECDLPAARATVCGDRACRVREMQARVRFAGCARNPLRRSCVSSARNQARARFAGCARNPLRRSCVLSARNAGESAICWLCAQPSAEIVCRLRKNHLRRSCVSSARNAGESAICRLCPQPSAEIARVECAKCRRECELPAVRATLCGDRACRVREMQARVRFAGYARNPLRRSCVSIATQRLWLTTGSGSQLAGCHCPDGKPARWLPS